MTASLLTAGLIVLAAAVVLVVAAVGLWVLLAIWGQPAVEAEVRYGGEPK